MLRGGPVCACPDWVCTPAGSPPAPPVCKAAAVWRGIQGVSRAPAAVRTVSATATGLRRGGPLPVVRSIAHLVLGRG